MHIDAKQTGRRSLSPLLIAGSTLPGRTWLVILHVLSGRLTRRVGIRGAAPSTPRSLCGPGAGARPDQIAHPASRTPAATTGPRTHHDHVSIRVSAIVACGPSAPARISIRPNATNAASTTAERSPFRRIPTRSRFARRLGTGLSSSPTYRPARSECDTTASPTEPPRSQYHPTVR